MTFMEGLVIFLLVYGAILLISAFAKIQFMIKLAKLKLGKDTTDKKALQLMYYSAFGLLIAGGIASFFT